MLDYNIVKFIVYRKELPVKVSQKEIDRFHTSAKDL